MVVLEELYRIRQQEFTEKLKEQSDPHIVYVTDLTSCSHKRVLRRNYPLLSFRFEPQMILGDLVHLGLESTLTGIKHERGRWVAEVEVNQEYEVEGEFYRLKGRADLVYYEDEEPSVVVEIKTSRDLPDNKPLEHHILQLQVYMNVLGASRGFLVYVTPERLVEFPIEKSSIDIKALLRETVENARRPRYEWECRYCPYSRLCPYSLNTRKQR